MSKSDQWINIILVVFILIHLSVLMIALVYQKTSWLTLLNAAAAVTVILYWIQKQLRIEQHFFDPTEVLVLCFEVAVIVLAVYSFLNKLGINWLRVVQNIIFGIHLSALALCLAFMLLFKIKRLI